MKKVSIYFNIYLSKYDKNRILLLVVGIPNGGAFLGGWGGVIHQAQGYPTTNLCKVSVPTPQKCANTDW